MSNKRNRWTTAQYIKFIDVWETDRTIDAVATELGITPQDAQRRFAHLRKQRLQLRSKGKLGGVSMDELKLHLNDLKAAQAPDPDKFLHPAGRNI